MQLILEGADEHEITCPHCQWHGIATELKKGDYFILTNITELFCPMCNKYVGFLQHDSGKADEKDSGPG